jgi:hypothetical protein
MRVAIGAGTASNIINEWKKGLDNSECESMRELAVFSKSELITRKDQASLVRLNNYIQKLGANQDEIETFIANIANSAEPEKLIDVANQVAQLSSAKSIPLEDFEEHVKHKEEEKQRLEEEIKHRRAILENIDVDIQTIEVYKQLKSGLSKYHLSSEDPKRLLPLLTTIKHYRYDPKKIVAEFSNIRSLKRRENIEDCEMLENRVADYRQVLPLLQRIRSMGIGIGKLLPFSLVVNEKAQKYNLSISAATYQLIEENYIRIRG